MKNVLVLFPCDGESRLALERAGAQRCEFIYREAGWTREEYGNALKKAHIIIGEPKNEDFAHCENLQWMQSPSSGVNYYVEGGAFPGGALLSSMTGCYGNIIAEHMLAMTLALCRRLPEYHDARKEHRWQWLRYDKQLEDCTVLILGAGDIGTTLAKWMRPMAKEVLGIRRTRREAPDCFDRMGTLEDLDDFLPRADILLCALPHTPATAGLLDERRLRLMKEDAVVVNGGRGSLLDQQALLKVMGEGKFFGVGLDVVTPEPLPGDSLLWDQPRLILTPHAAGNTFAPGSALYRKLWQAMTENLKRYLDTGTPGNLVDFREGYRVL